MKRWLFLVLSVGLYHDVFAVDFLSKDFVKKELELFEKNTKAYMNSPAPKAVKGSLYFDHQSITDRSFVSAKRDTRSTIIPAKRNHKSSPSTKDRVESLVDSQEILRNIFEMDSQKLTKGKVTIQPWSDDYWPIYKGILGARYADPEFDFIGLWDEAKNYVEKNQASVLYDTQDANIINTLSPSEKYDLLISNSHYVLTKRMWAEGKSYHDQYGEVETWMGICHGWAPASYMLPRPLKKVIVKSFDNKNEITFFPSDIKALASLLWAKTRSATRFVGGRCGSNDPEEDENGRIIAPECNDTNPGTWHMSVVNQIGILKSSFVMDATFDYEVWNQPLVGYSYKYFNPITKEPTEFLKDAIVKINDHKNDRFKKYRDSNAKYLVGVTMEVEYGVESSPIQRDEEDTRNDVTSNAFYMYDLELNDKYEVIGGEWYKNTHPDFLWTPPKGTRALSYADYYLLGVGNWDGKESLPLRWKELAIQSAQRGQPLAKLVESLIELSRK